MTSNNDLKKLAAEVKNPFITLGDKGDIHPASAPKDPAVKGIGGHSYTPKIGEAGEKGDTKPAKAPTYPSADIKAKNESKLLNEYMTQGEAGDIVAKPHDFTVPEHNSPDSKATSLAVCKDAPYSKKAFPLVWDVLPLKENQRVINAAYSDVLDCLKLIAVRAGVDLTTSDLGKAYKTIQASALAFKKASETSLSAEQAAVKELQKAKENISSVLEHENEEVQEIKAEGETEGSH